MALILHITNMNMILDTVPKESNFNSVSCISKDYFSLKLTSNLSSYGG